MNYPSKSKVNVAVSNNHDFDLSRQVVTTHDFGRVKPIECRYMVPGDKFNYRVSSFTRLLPMVSPTFGKIDTIQRAYFVPIRSLFSSIYDWLSNQPIEVEDGQWSSDSIVPYCTMFDFVQAFVGNPALTIQVDPEGTPTAAEFDIYCDYAVNSIHLVTDWTTANTPDYYKFTSEGRKLYDFFVSLGFNISFEYSYRNVKVSLLPFLAFWKCYLDWVVPSRFVKDYPVNIKYLLKELSRVDSPWQSGSSWDFHSTIGAATWFKKYFMNYPLSFYENDYFNSAWLYPFNEQGLANNLVIPNPSYNSDSDFQVNEVNFSPSVNHGSYNFVNGEDYINYFTIESLGKLQDYLNRGMLAGSKVQDWLLTEFGLRPSTDALNLSTYLGKISDTIRIGDVTSMADTAANDGQLLGAYAGKATGGSTGEFSYAAREHGYFIANTNSIAYLTKISREI